MKKLVAGLGLAIMMLIGGVMPVAGVYAANATNVCDDEEISDDLKQAAGCKDFKDKKKTAVPLALNIINVVLSFVGLIAVGVIIYGGVLYATSTGDASKAHKAKNSILYGVVGLVVAIMAFAIVSFINTSILKKS